MGLVVLIYNNHHIFDIFWQINELIINKRQNKESANRNIE